MKKTEGSGYVHGGGRKHVGIYPTEDEAARYEKACKAMGVTKSAQGTKLIVAWTERIEKQQEKKAKS